MPSTMIVVAHQARWAASAPVATGAAKPLPSRCCESHILVHSHHPYARIIIPLPLTDAGAAGCGSSIRSRHGVVLQSRWFDGGQMRDDEVGTRAVKRRGRSPRKERHSGMSRAPPLRDRAGVCACRPPGSCRRVGVVSSCRLETVSLASETRQVEWRRASNPGCAAASVGLETPGQGDRSCARWRCWLVVE